MERTSQIFFWASLVIMAIGLYDRVTVANELVDGVAPGSYWKAAIAFIGYSLASGQLARQRQTA